MITSIAKFNDTQNKLSFGLAIMTKMCKSYPKLKWKADTQWLWIGRGGACFISIAIGVAAFHFSFG